MKYYLGIIEAQNGENRYNQTIKFRTSSEPYQYLNHVVKTWYHFGGTLVTEAGGIQEIDKETFDKITLISEI